VILLMGTINALLLFQALAVSRQYDAIITNIATANSISSVKTDIDAAMWGIVAGNTLVDDGKQYAVINDVNSKLRQMQANTDSPRAKIKLDVIHRAMQDALSRSQPLGKTAEIRPYLQAFTLGQPRYTPAYIREQIRAADADGLDEERVLVLVAGLELVASDQRQ